MRIGMFCDMYKPHTSGITHYIELNKRRFEQLGHEVFVFTFGNLGNADDEANVVRSPALAWGSTGWQFGVKLSAQARELATTLDIAHVQHPFLSGRMALRYCAPHGIPIVFTNHTRYDLYSDVYAAFVPRAIRVAYLRRSLTAFAEHADAIIAPSVGIAEWLGGFGITRGVTVLGGGVDTERFAHPAQPASRADLDLAPDDVVFCYLGRLGFEKSVGTLVDAFVACARAQPASALLVIGDGPARGDMERRLTAAGLEERALFVGDTPYERVPDALAIADVFVTASVSETQGLVLVEAMAAGLPAVGIASPGLVDIVTDGVDGFLVDEPTAPALAARMAEVAGDAGLRARLGAAGRETSARYDIKAAADGLLEVYERVATAGAGRASAEGRD